MSSISRRLFSISIKQLKGHSKWANIKDTKSKSDAEKSKKITSFLNKMDKAVSEGGGTDTKTNKKLAKLQSDYTAEGLPMDSFRKRLEKLKEDMKSKKAS